MTNPDRYDDREEWAAGLFDGDTRSTATGRVSDRPADPDDYTPPTTREQL